MTKHWKRTTDGTYSFSLSVDSAEVGTMQIGFDSSERKAQCRIQGEDFTIKKTGFWRSTIEITNGAEEVIAKICPEKWYASSWIFEYNGKQYAIRVRNNPLAEYVIVDNAKEVAAYGIITDNGRVTVRITTSREDSDLLFDFLLWYLFVPIAIENMGDRLAFVLLLNNQ